MLTIYKASAGSGKTFTLSVEYIQLLLKDPTCYRRILAVTFTNKATEEMKTRILKDLYDIGYVWEKELDNQGIGNLVSIMEKDPKIGELGEKEIRHRARLALQNILHDYSSFNISTIDKYFQRVLRNLSRELGLTANLEIDLNDKEIIHQAVDNLFVSLADPAKKDLLDFVVEYAGRNLEDGEDWNIRRTIKDFAGEILPTDFYREKRQSIYEAFRDRKKVRETFEDMRNYLANLKRLAGSLAEKIERAGYASEMKRGTYSALLKIKNGETYDTTATLEKCAADAEEWTAKTKPQHEEITLYARKNLQSEVRELTSRLDGERETILSVKAALKNFYSTVILNEISEQVQKENLDANRFLLSDTQQLLKEIIGEEDTPFIFEKTGAFLEHVMIDEFQDTSRSQWRNFEVLLKHIEASGGNDLVVGDIKQSIYRWRNGDWRLLAGLDKNQGTFLTKSVTLGSNWRSSGNIVSFNNAFFSDFVKETDFLPDRPSELHEEAEDAYCEENVQQKTQKRKGRGLVRITRFSVKNGSKTNYNELCLKELDHTIRYLIGKGAGFKKKEVAVLTRTNSQIPAVAAQVRATLDAAGREDVRITSDLAFSLGSSRAVRGIVAALYLALDTQRQDPQEKRKAIAFHQALLVTETGCTEEEDPGSKLSDTVRWLPEQLKDERDYAALARMSLTESVAEIARRTGCDEAKNVEDGPFLSAFMDEVKDFAAEDGDLGRFLDYWENSLQKKTIQIEEGDGIRILTIHKSKGLEYDNVILFNANWKVELCENFWVENLKEDGLCSKDRLPVLSILKTKATADTHWKHAYEEEHLQTWFDSLNMLYVAFTRAKRNLFVCCKENGNIDCMSRHILNRIEDLEETQKILFKKADHTLTTDNAPTEEIMQEFTVQTWEYGEWEATETSETEGEASSNVFSFLPTPLLLDRFHTGGYEPVFWQSNGSVRWDPHEKSEDLTEREMGTAIHEFLSYLVTDDEKAIDQAVAQLKIAGRLSPDPHSPVSEKSLRDRMNYWKGNSTVREWFGGGWRLYNECSILSMKDGQIENRRPDRVMVKDSKAIVVDFKTGQRKEKYKKQVEEYMGLLKELGYEEISGYIWYFTEETEEAIVKVD